MDIKEMKQYLTNEDLKIASEMSWDFAIDYLLDTIGARKMDEALAKVLDGEEELIANFSN